MILEFWNTVWIYLFTKYLIGFRIDTSKLPFSIFIKFIPFYKVDFWYNSKIFYDKRNGFLNKQIDLIIPYLCDIVFVKQI